VNRLAETLSGVPIRAVYTSPLERALETAEAIARPHGLTPQLSEELGEVRAGSFEGETLADLDRREDWKRFNVFRGGTRAPGGELMIETQARMVRRIDALRQPHDGQVVALVSHADPLRAAIAHFLGISIDMLLRFEISPASVSVLELSDWGARVWCLNRTGEIPWEAS
jgi:probable phosphoglycerate mutase